MTLFHRTGDAETIQAEGFRDGSGKYMIDGDTEYEGVWFSDVPLDAQDGAHGDTLLAIDVPEEEIIKYEWPEEGKGFREFLIPAALANRFGPTRVVTREEENQIIDPRWKP